MDPSKLPHNPQTPHVPHHPSQKELTTPPQTSVSHYGSPLPGGFVPAEFWLTLVIGIIVLFISQEFIDYLRLLHHPEIFYAKYSIIDTATNNSIPYEQSMFFFPQMGVAIFGVVLIFDALTLLRPRWSILVWLALSLTVCSVALNIFAVIKGYDMAGFMFVIFNALAIAFGGYIALYQWRLLQLVRLS
jgi:hypothetical protein